MIKHRKSLRPFVALPLHTTRSHFAQGGITTKKKLGVETKKDSGAKNAGVRVYV